VEIPADHTRTPRRIAAGVLVSSALAVLAVLGYTGGAGIAIGAYYYYCPNGGAGYGYCPPPEPPRVAGHFVNYQLDKTKELGETLTAVDQFGTVRIRLMEPRWLFNPTEKRRTGKPTEPLQRPDEHLLCYGVNRSQPPRIVQIKNQFATSTLRTADILALCAPASKSETGAAGPRPTDLDHYLCYDVTFESPKAGSETVGVKDQFGERTLRLGPARELCNPVEKRRDARPPEPILRPTEHFVCYRASVVQPPVPVRTVFTNDQFGPRQVRVTKSLGTTSSLQRLCVPSTKQP
jgi:hypothetical protein